MKQSLFGSLRRLFKLLLLVVGVWLLIMAYHSDDWYSWAVLGALALAYFIDYEAP